MGVKMKKNILLFLTLCSIFIIGSCKPNGDTPKIEDLPVEIQMEILNNMDTPDLVNTAQTNKAVKDLAYKILLERKILFEKNQELAKELMGFMLPLRYDGKFGGPKEEDVEKFLAKTGLDVDTKDESGHASLHYAVLIHSLLGTKFLIIKGANVNIRNSEGKTPLHFIAEKTVPKAQEVGFHMAQLLFEEGADINVVSNSGDTPLSLAIRNRNFELIKLFLGEKAKSVIESIRESIFGKKEEEKAGKEEEEE